MSFFRRITKIVEARQYTRNGLEAEKVAEWCGGEQTNEGCVIKSHRDYVCVDYGDWIVKDGDGDFDAYHNDFFRKNFRCECSHDVDEFYKE